MTSTTFDPLPPELHAALAQALTEVELRPDHDLILGLRQRIWERMGTRSPIAQPWIRSGCRRRALLAIRSAERVLPLWVESRPEDTHPQDALLEARRALDEPEHAARLCVWKPGAGRVTDRLSFYFLGMPDEGPIDPLVGLAATTALGVALYDEDFEPGAVDPSRTLEGAETEDLDAAAWAAMAYANGPAHDPDSDPEKRREFWHWWLSEAVPAAYREGTLEQDA